MSKSTRTTRALTVAATIVALLLSMAAFTLPVDEGLEVTDGVADAAALVPVGEVGDTVGGAVEVVTEAVPLLESEPEVVGVEPVLPSPGSPVPEPPPAPEAAPAPAPAPVSDSAPEPTSAPAAPAPTPQPAARPEAPAATPGPSTSPAPGDASPDAESDGASAPAEPAESARDVAAAGDAVAPPQPVGQLSAVETAALKSSSVAGSEPGSGAGSHPVLQPLVAPPFEQDGPASALAPLVAPPATTGLSDLLTSGPRLDAAPVRLPSADAPVWLLATAFGLLVLTVAGHAGRFARQRAGTRS